MVGLSQNLDTDCLCEGFGLPLIEAAHYKLPAIVSDIPVFREIGGNSTRYFELDNSTMLSDCIKQALNTSKAVPDISILTWKQSVESMLDIIKSSKYQYVRKQ